MLFQDQNTGIFSLRNQVKIWSKQLIKCTPKMKLILKNKPVQKGNKLFNKLNWNKHKLNNRYKQVCSCNITYCFLEILPIKLVSRSFAGNLWSDWERTGSFRWYYIWGSCRLWAGWQQLLYWMCSGNFTTTSWNHIQWKPNKLIIKIYFISMLHKTNLKNDCFSELLLLWYILKIVGWDYLLVVHRLWLNL